VCLELGSFRLLWVVVCGTGTVPCVTAYKWAKVFHMHPQDVDKMDSTDLAGVAVWVLWGVVVGPPLGFWAQFRCVSGRPLERVGVEGETPVRENTFVVSDDCPRAG
jgi:hypothetical protein